jgi:acyl-CoA dehydrogenase
MTSVRRSLDVVAQIARDVAAPAADEVDRAGRSPVEAIDALRDAGLLGVTLEGRGEPWSLGSVTAAATTLGRACSSTGMIWAMHHSQLLAVVRHGGSGGIWDDIRARLARGGLLVASAASEGSGALATADAAVVPAGGAGVMIEKHASVVSYGADADAFLVSARRHGDAKPNDLVLAFAWGDQSEKIVTGTWDALGMRGTASTPMVLRSTIPAAQIFTPSFEVVYRSTVVPAAHVLWAACWLGIGEAALDRARRYLRGAAAPAGALLELAASASDLEIVRRLVDEGVRRSEGGVDDSLTSGLWFNDLKIQASTRATAAVLGALRILGVRGYVEGERYSVARFVRDILSAEIMVGNHRLREANSTIELVRRDPQR